MWCLNIDVYHLKSFLFFFIYEPPKKQKGKLGQVWLKIKNSLNAAQYVLSLWTHFVPAAMQRMKIFLMVLLQDSSAEERIKRWCSFKATHLQGLDRVNQMFRGSLFIFPNAVALNNAWLDESNFSQPVLPIHLYNFSPHHWKKAYSSKEVV